MIFFLGEKFIFKCLNINEAKNIYIQIIITPPESYFKLMMYLSVIILAQFK
jgi:hypothetical protein